MYNSHCMLSVLGIPDSWHDLVQYLPVHPQVQAIQAIQYIFSNYLPTKDEGQILSYAFCVSAPRFYSITVHSDPACPLGFFSCEIYQNRTLDKSLQIRCCVVDCQGVNKLSQAQLCLGKKLWTVNSLTTIGCKEQHYLQNLQTGRWKNIYFI